MVGMGKQRKDVIVRQHEFDLDQGRSARDQAIRDVGDHAEEEADRLYEAACSVARLGEPFTTDDVWKAAGPCESHDPRVMGAVMRRLQRAGHARPTNRYESSELVACHARPKRVWEAR